MLRLQEAVEQLTVLEQEKVEEYQTPQYLTSMDHLGKVKVVMVVNVHQTLAAEVLDLLMVVPVVYLKTVVVPEEDTVE